MTEAGSDAPTEQELERARALVRNARAIVVLTGAGVSAESGVPTFRGAGGLWKEHRPEDLATPQAFARDPRLVWEWYAWRRSLVAGCSPNPAHVALASLALSDERATTLVTQNVDGLHHRAAIDVAGDAAAGPPGFPIELHGAIHRDRCSRCAVRTEGAGEVDTSSTDTLPRCADCDALLRPDVVWFGEALDPAVIGTAFDAAHEADVCIVVGTSAVVHPAASIPAATLRRGGRLVEVNPDATPLSAYADIALRGAAGKLVPALLA